MSFNPKREFVIERRPSDIKNAIREVQHHYSREYRIDDFNETFNHFRLLKTGVLLSSGFYIDVILVKQGDNETKITVEVSQKAGMINTNSEGGVASKIINTFSKRLRNALEGSIETIAAQEEDDLKRGNNFLSKFLWVIITIVILIFAFFIYQGRQH